MCYLHFIRLLLALFNATLCVFAAGGAFLPEMTREEAALAPPCCVTGVVTSAAAWMRGAGTLADIDAPDGRAVWLYVPPAAKNPPEIAEGDVVEARGSVDKLGFKPGIRAQSIVKIGQMPLGAPPERKLHEFAWGRLDNTRATVAGRVLDAQECDYPVLDGSPRVRLLLGTTEGVFAAYVPGSVGEWRERIDGVYAFAGIGMSFFNYRGEFKGLRLEVASGEGRIRMLEPPPGEAFALPFTPLEKAVGTFGRQTPVGRIHVRGVAVYSGSRGVWIADGKGSLRLEPAPGKERVAVGESVEAAGFGFPTDDGAVLCSARIRKSQEPLERVAPLAVEDGGMTGFVGREWFENYDGRLVTLRGRVRSAAEDGGGTRIALESGRDTIECLLDGGLGEETMEALSLCPQVAVTGLFLMAVEPGLPGGRLPQVAGARLLLRTGGDIAIIKDGELEGRMLRVRLRKSATGAAGILAVLLALAAWRVAKLRRERARLRLMGEERKRMAGELHDTVEQHLLGAGMLLENVQPQGRDAMDAIALARRSLAFAKDELRAAVWNLRSDELFSSTPCEAVRRMAAGFPQTDALRLRCRFAAAPAKMDGAALANVVQILREAAVNAVKHGHARNIVFSCDRASGGGYRFAAANDGAPFDPAAAPRSDAGHFGLDGMDLRARRIGARLDFSRRGNWNIVSVEVKA